MQDFEINILKANLNRQLNVIVNSDDFDLFKSWSSDLQKQFPNGSWRTVNGAKVFLHEGKVVAGLDGFNGKIDEFFEKKDKESEEKPKSLNELINELNSIKTIEQLNDFMNANSLDKLKDSEKSTFEYYLDSKKAKLNFKPKNIKSQKSKPKKEDKKQPSEFYHKENAMKGELIQSKRISKETLEKLDQMEGVSYTLTDKNGDVTDYVGEASELMITNWNNGIKHTTIKLPKNKVWSFDDIMATFASKSEKSMFKLSDYLKNITGSHDVNMQATSYGIGVDNSFGKRTETLNKVRQALKDKNISFKEEYSDAKWVHKFIVNKDSENIEKIINLK